jgi:hypothetical protein
LSLHAWLSNKCEGGSLGEEEGGKDVLHCQNRLKVNRVFDG